MKSRRVHLISGGLLGPALVVALAAGAAWANVYVSGVTVDATGFDDVCGSLKVSYILNESANGDGTRPGIQIEVLDSSDPPVAVRTFSIAAQVKGLHIWEWDGRKDDGSLAANGTYSIRITAADMGHTSWTVISDADAAHSFFNGKSVAVNKRQASPYYGMVYVAESRGGAMSGRRTTQDGIYALYADGREAYFSNAVDPAGTMTDWIHDGTNASAPYKLNVGADDDRVYVTSYYDDLAFDFPPDLANCTQLIASGNKSANQYVSSAYATGTKDLANRKLWLVNSNYNDTSRKGLIRYNLNANDKMGATAKGTPYVGAAAYTYYPMDVDRDPVSANDPPDDPATSGDFYMNTYRASPDQAPAIQKFDGNATTLPVTTSLWDSSDDYTYPLGIGFGRDEFAQPGWPKNIIAYGRESSGHVYFFNANTGAFLDSLQVEASGSIGDVAFDDAGNLYTIVSVAPRYLRVWSPPDGPNYKAFTTGTFALNKTSTSGPTITTPPADAILCPGGTAAFTVEATGSNVTYQWMKDGVNLVDGADVAGATTASLSLTNVPASYSGAQIIVLVCDDNGVVISPPALLQTGVYFIQPPAALIVCQNTDVTFTVNATGKGTLSYQWQKDNAGDGAFVDIADATSPTLTETAVTTAMNNTQYKVIVTDECGPTASPVAKLTVKGNPVITHVGHGKTVAYGANHYLTCYATGTGLLTYQWAKDGVDIPGATSAGYDIINATCADAGLYSCTVTDDCGIATSSTPSGGGEARIIVSSVDVCGDGIDQDCDGTIDEGQNENTVNRCGDGIDNDCDGLIDCADPQCAGKGSCCNAPWADAEGPGGIGAGLGDRDVDQADFGVFQLCFTGSVGVMPTEPAYCSCLDRTGPGGVPDAVIDSYDLEAFTKCATGPMVPWASNPDCP